MLPKSAFPLHEAYIGYLRDYFAGQALAGFLADGSQRLIAEAAEHDFAISEIDDPVQRAAIVNNQIAIGVYQLADAMLAERAKGQS